MSDIKDKINVSYTVKVDAEIIVHSFEDNVPQYVSIDTYAGCEVEDGKTIIRYYTGWDDNPYDGFPIRETTEEVDELFRTARAMQMKEYSNLTCIHKDYASFNLCINSLT